MKVLVAGATGAIGRQLVPRLIAAGHEVVGMARSASKRETLSELGASAVLADALVAEQVADAVAQAQPEVIVHELTAIPETLDMRHFDRDFEMTNRLRTEGTDHLLSPARRSGCAGLWPRATPGGRSLAAERRSRPRQTNSTQIPCRRCGEASRRLCISSGR